MRHFDAEAVFDSDAQTAFTSFAEADSLKDFMPGIVSSEIAVLNAADDLGPLDYEVDVRVGLSFFSGKMRAAVEVEREQRTVRVRLLNGPVKSANALITVEPQNDHAHVRVALDYKEPIGPLDLLIGRFQERAVARVLGAYAERAKAMGSGG